MLLTLRWLFIQIQSTSAYVEDTIDAMDGRAVHTYHTEGAGGGHARDIMKIAGEQFALPSSTNSTRPYTINTIDEHLDMLMFAHHLNPAVPEDVAFAESRIRAETIAAVYLLQECSVYMQVCFIFMTTKYYFRSHLHILPAN